MATTTTPTDSQKPIQRLNHRQLTGSAEYYYHQYRLHEEHLHDALKAVLAGEHTNQKAIDRLVARRNDALDTHLQFSAEIIRRLKTDDNLLASHLRDREASRRRSAKKHSILIEEQQ